MRSRSSKGQSDACRERGVYLIMGSALLVFLFAILGFAIDQGQVSVSQSRLQRAVDAAVFVSGDLLRSGSEEEVRELAEAVVRDNLSLLGAKAPAKGSATVDVRYAGGASKVGFVEGKLPVPLVVLGFVPGLRQTSLVSARAQIVARRVVVSLVLDVTGSMALPDPDAPEDPPPIDVVRPSVQAFLGFFHEGADWLGISSFSRSTLFPNYARVVCPMSSDFDVCREAIEGIEARGRTSLAEGIALGHQEIMDLDPTIRDEAAKYLVVLSDGAPNVGSEGFDDAECPGLEEGKKYYIQAIRAADAARMDDIEVIVLALGKQPLGEDIYQGVADDQSLKPHLLRRIANTADPDLEEKEIPYFDCGVPDYRTYNDPKNPANVGRGKMPRRGKYLDTSRASEVPTMLRAIAAGVQPRLVAPDLGIEGDMG
jgi:Flp pilus assembly protein TadG